MFNWDGCPAGLFDMYMEVGQVIPGETLPDGSVLVEIWVGDCFTQSHCRPELESVVRRPVYGIYKQILKFCGERKAVLVFQCDDRPGVIGGDTENWSVAIYLLLRALKKTGKLSGSILFTRKTEGDIRSRDLTHSIYPHEQEHYDALYQSLDILVTCQPNRFAPPENRKVFCRNEALLRNLPFLPEPNSVL